jgi:hypothetical protein
MRHNSVIALPITRLIVRLMANAMHNTALFDHERRIGGLRKRQTYGMPPSVFRVYFRVKAAAMQHLKRAQACQQYLLSR